MTDDERSCLERLELFERRLSLLMDAIPGGARMVKQDEDLITRALFHDIKANLEREFKAGDSTRGQAALTEAERLWYYPHIQQAHAYWRSPTNAKLDQKLYEVVVRQSAEAGLEYEDGPAY